ncbi:MAG: fibronectin type III domain-containing protein [Gemmatimonadota bacterium]
MAFQISGLKASTSYLWRATAGNVAGSVRILEAVFSTPAELPGAPSSLAAVGVSESDVALSWGDADDREREFQLERRKEPSLVWDLLTILPENSTSYRARNLEPSSSYYFRIRACNTAGCSEWTLSTAAETLRTAVSPSVTTEDAIEITQSAARLRGTVVTGSIVAEVWFDLAADPAFAGPTKTQMLPQLPSSVPVAFSIDVSALRPETQYYFRAAASNSAGITYGRVLSFVTVPTTSVPNAPSHLTTKSGTGTIVLVWNDNSADEREFRIEYVRPGTNQWIPLGSVPTNVTQFNHEGLAPGIVFRYRILACSHVGCSAPSNESSGTVAGTPPTVNTDPMPIITQTGAIVRGSVNAHWEPTTAWLEWAADSLFLNAGRSEPQDVGSGANDVLVQADLASLSANQRYYYRAVARNTSGTTYGSAATARISVPDSPELAASLLANYTVEVTWRAKPETGGSVSIQRRTDAGTWYSQFLFDRAPSPGDPGWDIEYDLEREHILDYIAYACNARGCGDTANVSIASNALGAPSDLLTTSSTTASVILDWRDNSLGESGFNVYRRGVNTLFQRVGTTGHNQTRFEDTSALQGVTYYYVIRAHVYNAYQRGKGGTDRESLASNEASITLR